MVNWKNLKASPPKMDCDICVRVGDNYETYKFKVYSECNWGLVKYPITIESSKIPEEAWYINLNEIL